MNKLKISVSPHIHSGRSTRGIMRDVLIALAPAAIAGTVIFGLRSLLVMAVCTASCILFEALFNIITKKEQSIGDLSAAVTGLLLALNLPVEIPLWQCVIGSLFAIVIVKCLFGGIGANPVNPAITARVFMLVSFGEVTIQSFPTIVDTATGATPLSLQTHEHLPKLSDLFLGVHGGAIGETCARAIIIGFIYLLVRRVISWHIPVAFVGTVFLLSFCLEGFDPIIALSMIFSGSLLIGAVFMATDYVTSPATPWGKIIFGLGAGIITVLIRYFGSYPEGVSFAILFMNILTPYIEALTKHRVLGVGGKKA